jgi:hypothetical protein
MVGVLIGMQQANNGLNNLKGMENASNASETKMEYTSEKLTSKDLEEKQKQLEQIKGFNLFSSLGTALSQLLQAVMDSIFSMTTKLIEGIL